MKYILTLIVVLFIANYTSSYQVSFLKSGYASLAISEMKNFETEVFQGLCFVKIHNYFYDLNPLSEIINNSNNGFSIQQENGQTLAFNFCENVKTSCESVEGLMVSKERCKKFANNYHFEKSWKITNNSNGTDILILELPPGDICQRNHNNIKRYNSTLELVCDQNESSVKIFTDNKFNPLNCNNVIRMSSKFACKKSKFSEWWNKFGINDKGIAVVLVFVGLYFLIFGVMFWKTNSLIINCLILGLIIYNISSLFFKVSLVVCFLLGVALSIGVLFFESSNGTALGVIVGYLLGNLLYNFLFQLISINPQTLYLASVISSILTISIAGGFMKDYMVRCATSLLGAYAFVRGISIFLGGYPDERYVMKLLNKKEYNQFRREYGPQLYGYLISIIIISLIGVIIQTCCCNGQKNIEKVDKTEDSSTLNVQIIEKDANTNEVGKNCVHKGQSKAE